jgi:orotate phosphoribosyltransferase
MFYTNYSSSTLERGELRKNARLVTAMLRVLHKRLKFDFIAVQGKSGLSMAFASAVHHDFPIVAVRKDNESSHGSAVEGPCLVLPEGGSYIILDDFVASGETCVRIIDKLTDYARSNPGRVYNMERGEYDCTDRHLTCVGVLQYCVAANAEGEPTDDGYGTKMYLPGRSGVPLFGSK